MRTGNRGAGFTLIELLVTIVVVAALITLVSLAVRGGARLAGRASDQFMATGMATSTEHFKNEFGFLPGLVVDGEPLANASEGPILEDTPLQGLRAVALRDAAFMRARRADGTMDPAIVGPVNGLAGPNASYSDKRYSKLTIPYYEMGASGVRHNRPSPDDKEIDWVEGAGMKTPMRDGRWDPRGKTHESFYSPRQSDRVVRGYVDVLEYREHLGSNPGDIDGPTSSVAVVDRKGRAFRYYRWENGEPKRAGDALGRFLNIPRILQNPATWADPDASAGDGQDGLRYRDAAYAIVGAGPDGLFGTEPVSELELQMGPLSDNGDAGAVAELRRKAAEDNVVEVGK
ncbi:MAG: type II secretion system protein [Phycisphaeraceae bacterium]|nr:type II secretion system protein [Phycisphaeraceae bacterium]